MILFHRNTVEAFSTTHADFLGPLVIVCQCKNHNPGFLDFVAFEKTEWIQLRDATCIGLARARRN